MLAPHAVLVAQTLDHGDGFQQRSDFVFLLAGEIARPVLDLVDHFLQSRVPALVEAAFELVFVRELAVVLFELLLHGDDLFRR